MIRSQTGPTMHLIEKSICVCLVHFCLVVCAYRTPASEIESELPRIGIFQESALGVVATTADALKSSLSRAGLAARLVSADELSDPAVFNRDHFDVMILPMADAFPAPAQAVLLKFLADGGNLLAVGNPQFTNPAWKKAGEWMDRNRFNEKMKTGTVNERDFQLRPLCDFSVPQSGWSRTSNEPSSPATFEIRPEGSAAKKNCLVMSVANLTNWDCWKTNLGIESSSAPILSLNAKGDAKTTQLYLEMDERDGSRWAASVDITTEWKRHQVKPGDFKFWSGGNGRGSAGDQVKFGNVSSLVLGLALSHNTKLSPGPHTVWVEDISAPQHPLGAFASAEEPSIDCMSPAFRTYPITQYKTIDVSSKQAIVRKAALPAIARPFSAVSRGQGIGFERGRKARFVPLILALDDKGRRNGNVAWMLINKEGPYAKSSWAGFGLDNPELLADAGIQNVIADIVGHMQSGVRLYEGGSQYDVYFQGESVKLGAEIINYGRKVSKALTVRIAVKSKAEGTILFTKEFRIAPIEPGNNAVVTAEWPAKKFNERWYDISTELLDASKPIDLLQHELQVAEVKTAAERQYLSVKDGDFYLAGQKWYPHGINYLPASGVGSDDWNYYESYAGSHAYDSELDDEDLSRIADLGLNMISLFVNGPQHRTRNILDLTLRCEKYGLKVNFNFRPYSDPMNFQWDGLKDMIESLRLAEFDNIVAFDLAWEMMWNHYKEKYDPQFGPWLIERYGSIENAEKDWGYPAPRNQAGVTGPPREHLENEGAWLKMAAAYRRFVDDTVSKKHTRAVRLIKSIDPNHLISFRMAYAGNGRRAFYFPYDYRSFKSLDFLSPEAWMSGTDEVVFNAAYARHAAPGKPIFWAEFGTNLLGGGPPCPNIGQMYEMVWRSGAHGSAVWVYPSGYRIDEKSNYGVMNLDGSPTSASTAIKEWAEKMKAPRAVPPVATSITIDRDASALGLTGEYQRVHGAFFQAFNAGKFPGLHDEGTGTTSLNTPLKAVGNSDYNGRNPPKYLNAEFNYVRIKDAKGHWVEVVPGARIEVTANQRVMCEASIGNLQDATWIAPVNARDAKGAVYLASPEGSQLQLRAPIPYDTKYFADAVLPEFALSAGVSSETTVILQMTAEARAWFGEKLAFVLVPVR
jgi:hypothetical protein